MVPTRARGRVEAVSGPGITAKDHPNVDPERDISSNPFDNPDGYFGQDYSPEREAEMGRQNPSGHPLTGDHSAVTQPSEDPHSRDIPPENGRRAWSDPETGEVHGSGSGAGGGNDGEDFDDATPEGS